jgi:hypothetical protein
MPINGLTNVPKMFLKLGQIRKGEKITVEQDGKKYDKPVDLDYFRVTFFEDAKRAEEQFVRAYGAKPQEINVRLAFPEVAEVWDANYEAYLKGGMYAKAASTPERGAYWIFYRDFISGEVFIRGGLPTCPDGAEILTKTLDLSAPIFSYKNNKNEMTPVFFEQVGRLNVVVPEIAEVAVGYLEFRATSPRDIRNISAELAAYDMQARQVGKTITGIPFILRRREEEITKNINGKLSRGKSWVVHLDMGGEWASKALTVIERLALPEFVEAEVKEIPNGDNWDGAIFEEDKPEPEPLKTTAKIEDDIDKDFPPQPATSPTSKTPEHIKGMKITPQDILDQGLSESVQSASWMVNKLLLVNKPLDEGLEICKLYRRWRNSGLEAKDAAVKTLAGEQPPTQKE